MPQNLTHNTNKSVMSSSLYSITSIQIDETFVNYLIKFSIQVVTHACFGPPAVPSLCSCSINSHTLLFKSIALK